MKCYDCGGEIASGTGTCPSCGPAGRDERRRVPRARLLTAQAQTESNRPSTSWAARSAVFAAALLALSGVVELVNAQENG